MNKRMTKEQMIKEFTDMISKADFIEHEETLNNHHAFEFRIPGKEYGFWLMEKDGKVEWF